jgi:hypothetical protein
MLVTSGCGLLYRTGDIQEAEFKPLLNGNNLDGWTAAPGGNWSVSNGVLTGTSPASEKRHGVLISEQSYTNFEVRLEYLAVAGNSGFYFRSEPKDHVVSIAGFQAEIDATGKNCGGLYETLGRKWVVTPDKSIQAFKPGEWNSMTVRAVENHITITLNGVTTADLPNDTGRPAGHFGFQLHGGQEMNISFRNILIKEL